MGIERNYLFNKDKLNYVKGDKPQVDCILCSIANQSPDVNNLEVFRTDRFIVSVNLYPYNPGHLMIFPVRHIVDFFELNDDEVLEMHRLTGDAISILKDEYNPSGFNMGCNLGNGSGASIPHIHQHIVPRYGNETGFIDAISGTRLFVMDPVEMMNNLKKKFENINK